MSQVLIIDEIALFRDYVKDKLVSEKVDVETSSALNDGFKKLFSGLPNILIMDITFPFEVLMEFLERKNNNANAKSIPIILIGPVLEQSQLDALRPYRIVKYINKPIKIDLFFDTISKILKVAIPFDYTDCVLEAHVSGEAIFIELSKGLNREKIALLPYKITDLITENKIQSPKIVLMVSNIDLCFVDGCNIELLMNSILHSDSRVRDKRVKVLTMNKFITEFIAGHTEYTNVQVTNEIGQFIYDVVPKTDSYFEFQDLTTLLITPSEGASNGSITMKFKSEDGGEKVVDGVVTSTDTSAVELAMKAAIIDDDTITQQVLLKQFTEVNCKTDIYLNGADFLSEVEDKNYDVVVLDIVMPGLSGFDVLSALQSLEKPPLVIVYSSISQKEQVVKALSLGAKMYLIKPQKPELIVQTAQKLLFQARNGL
ncbi:MAG: response regulator [Treponemataceae bacterium]|nr:response regulator [Treponemataceae bacterium]